MALRKHGETWDPRQQQMEIIRMAPWLTTRPMYEIALNSRHLSGPQWRGSIDKEGSRKNSIHAANKRAQHPSSPVLHHLTSWKNEGNSIQMERVEECMLGRQSAAIGEIRFLISKQLQLVCGRRSSEVHATSAGEHEVCGTRDGGSCPAEIWNQYLLWQAEMHTQPSITLVQKVSNRRTREVSKQAA